jgi:protein-S-isoprenylcysteine O-methyltransferase Ste14
VNTETSQAQGAKTQVRYAIAGAELFGITGGPIAWFVQFCAGYGLASWPCFPKSQRALTPLAGYDWTWPAMIAVLIAGVLVALGALLISLRNYQRTQGAPQRRELVDDGASRRHFLALWGIVLGAGFALASLITAVAFVVLPRCAS